MDPIVKPEISGPANGEAEAFAPNPTDPARTAETRAAAKIDDNDAENYQPTTLEQSTPGPTVQQPQGEKYVMSFVTQ